MCETCGCHANPLSDIMTRRLSLQINLLDRNEGFAKANRERFQQLGLTVINLMSGPGSGKTRLLEATLPALRHIGCGVVEGDLQTERDAERIRATGAPVVQINTGKSCHLDADAITLALDKLPLKEMRLLFIENVGNLVCPAAFDLGESRRVVLLSVTEGEDKPLKYPDMFYDAHLILLNKIDLLPHLAYDIEQVRQNIATINPRVPVFEISAQTGEGLEAWINWLNQTITSTTIP
jgi:hydrogenase nickel incorporation protein HypB